MNLWSGITIPEFLKMFPAASEDQIKAVLDFLSDRLEETGTDSVSRPLVPTVTGRDRPSVP
ncbi:MAG: hypothetical protein OXG35_13055 [Acidobacteria bacterium]|nr:hypothetical protein [Acidobacteriota bacterium]